MNRNTEKTSASPYVQLGPPRDDVPKSRATEQDEKQAREEARSRARAPHWWAAAEYGRENPGKWFSVKVPTLAPNSYSPSALAIRKGEILAFHEDRWDTRIVAGCLWIKYLGPRPYPIAPDGRIDLTNLSTGDSEIPCPACGMLPKHAGRKAA